MGGGDFSFCSRGELNLSETRADRKEKTPVLGMRRKPKLPDRRRERDGSRGDLQHPFSYKFTKQDSRFHRDQQTVTLLKGLVGLPAALSDWIVEMLQTVPEAPGLRCCF